MNQPTTVISVASELTANQIESINSLLRDHNQSANPHWWAALDDPANDPKSLQVMAVTDTGDVVGGVLATTSLSWLKVTIMVVCQQYRRQGIGSRMLLAAENEAAKRGCRYAFLDTMQYQAPDFYRSCGYQVAGTIPDWDSHGHAKYFFTKSISTDS